MRKLTTEDFIAKAKSVHGDKYDYSNSVYLKSNQKITITCRHHGDFYQTPSNHMHGFGCNRCARDIIESARRMTFDDFLCKTKSLHGEKYLYKQESYKNTTSKMTIICRKHGNFSQTPKKHLMGQGCPVCGGSARSNNDEFIAKSKKIHGNKYDYSLVNYSSAKNKVIIVCRNHGFFMQVPTNHLHGKGCPACASYGFKRTEKKAYVYFLESVATGAVKIGVTHNSSERISRITKNTPFQFDVIKIVITSGFNAAKIESNFHKKFNSAEFSGFDGCTEWVVKTPLLMEEIKKLTPQ